MRRRRSVWPEGYLNLANSLGLTDGVSLAYSAPITRAQTAQLFVNTLRCKTASGRPTTRPWAPL